VLLDQSLVGSASFLSYGDSRVKAVGTAGVILPGWKGYNKGGIELDGH